MLKYKWLLITLSVLFAILATFIGHKIFVSSIEKYQDEGTVLIPVANNEIPPMTQITEDFIVMKEMPKDISAEFPIILTKEELLNKFSSQRIYKGIPFFESFIITDNMQNPFVLPEGYRAITLGVDAISSVGGYLESDMFVDILWTHQSQEEAVTKIVFQNVQILAVGNKGESNLQIKSAAGPATITLKMTPQDAQKLTLLNSTGEIKFILRPSQIEEVKQIQSSFLRQMIN